MEEGGNEGNGLSKSPVLLKAEVLTETVLTVATGEKSRTPFHFCPLTGGLGMSLARGTNPRNFCHLSQLGQA